MTTEIEKTISNLVAYQFPQFYREEGPVFVSFVKAYFEWAEQEGNFLYQGRRIYDNRDIDETIEAFLYYFQKKYLYGIPFDVIINKRYLLKHVLDVYRSKGSIQCYRLLFRLIYDQDIDIYLPGRDVLRLSDGTWKDPRYLEVTNVADLGELVGTTILGLSSQTQAVVESYVTEVVNQNIIALLYISNIRPRGGTFDQGEKIIDIRDRTSANLASIVGASPTVIGSLDYVEIVDGGSSFNIGDVLKVASRDPANNAVISFGRDATVRVTAVREGLGQVNFSIFKEGTGVLLDPDVFIYNQVSDTTGSGASFEVADVYNQTVYSYNEDLIADYVDKTLNSSSFGFPASPSANIGNTLAVALTYYSNTFGSLFSLNNENPGSDYTANPYIMVRSVHLSNALPGTLTFDTTSTTVTGVGTEFQRFLANDDMVVLQANTNDPATKVKYIVKQVVSNTSLTLYGKPVNNSTASAAYFVAPNIISSQYATYEAPMATEDGSIPGLNANVVGQISVGNNVIATVSAVNSGKGYIDGENVRMFLYGPVNEPTILTGGTGYTNGDLVLFSGGNPIKIAKGEVRTDANGTITSVVMDTFGSGYQSVPTVYIRSETGSNGSLACTVAEIDTDQDATGIVRKAGVGRAPGYWTTTRGFLSADKYIQDSYFYQDFSYQIRAASTLERYREILYNTFHVAGTELFGDFLLVETDEQLQSIITENTSIAAISSMLLENNDDLLTEDGFRILLE
jgi:hypothetical protein